MSLQAHVSEAFGECNETRRLLIEWREASRPFREPNIGTMVTMPGLREFDRLRKAQDALFAYAEQYRPRHEEPQP